VCSCFSVHLAYALCALSHPTLSYKKRTVVIVIMIILSSDLGLI
jgi:hypothetical protein